MKVLLLGANGYMGPHLVKVLEKFYQLRITDIMPIESEHETMVVDVTDLGQVMEATEGMDAIINCSVLRHDRKLAFDVSARGSYNVMRSAVNRKIQRIIQTGPWTATNGQMTFDLDFELNPDSSPSPGTEVYALTKSLGQEICKVFTENYHSLYVQCYLFSIFVDYDDPREGCDSNEFQLSWRDTAELFRLGLEIKLTDLPSRFEIFYPSADLPHQKFKFDKARKILGFVPRDGFEKMWQREQMMERKQP